MTRGTVQINTGANASEDPDGVKEDDPLEDGPTQVNDVVDGFRLNQTPPYDRKEEFAKAIMSMFAP